MRPLSIPIIYFATLLRGHTLKAIPVGRGPALAVSERMLCGMRVAQKATSRAVVIRDGGTIGILTQTHAFCESECFHLHLLWGN